MSALGPIVPRITSLLTSDQLLAQLRQTQFDITQMSNQISTGKTVTKPSDAPGSASAILQLQGQLSARTQHDQNLSFAQSILNNTDQAMADVTDIVSQATSVGSSQIGIGSTTDTRTNQAAVIDQQIQAMLEIANRRQQNVSLFGGSTSPATNQYGGDVFVEFMGGIRYIGSDTNLASDLGMRQPLAVNSNGQDAFGALSTRVISQKDLNPQATAATRLSDLGGATNQGVRVGAVQLTVGATTTTVDLTGAETLDDVLKRVNAAINQIDGTAGSLSISGSSLSLTATAGHSISITDSKSGAAASDLGINLSAAGGSVLGGDLNPRLTTLTPLVALTGVNFTGGLKITQGTTTKVADFTGATTVQDLANVIDSLGMGLRLEVNDQGTGLNLVSDVSGVDLSVGENNGGTTATDLGLRSLGLDTKLADLNFGMGVSHTAGQNDFSLQLHAGATFNVSIDGAITVGDVVQRIHDAAMAAGLTVGNPGDAGTQFNIGLARDGNGLAMEDNTAGAREFMVTQLGTSLTASDLGIATSAGNGATISGADVGQVRTESVFTHLIQLRDALLKDDSRGITVATASLQTDTSKLSGARADVGVRAQRVQQQQQRSADLKLSEQSMLSDLQDADLTSVITRYTQLQQQLQASLQVGSKTMQTSLLDFLR